MLIIEGSDHLGKSTLAKAIATKIEEVTGSAPEIKALTREDGEMSISEYMSLVQPWTIYDRFHLSELAYSAAISDRASRLSLKGAHLISHTIMAMGGICVMLHTAGLYKHVVEVGAWEQQNQLFDVETCAAVDGLYTRSGKTFAGPLDTHAFKVTTGRTRKGVDWPASRDLVVEMLANKYIDHQKALGHGVPPNRDDMRSERGLPDYAHGGVLALKEARNHLVKSVIASFANTAEVDPTQYALIEEGHELAEGAGYQRTWAFDKRPEGGSNGVQAAGKKS